jgi:hypothetical protein
MDMRGRILRRIRQFITAMRFIVPVAWRAAGIVFYNFLFTFASLWRGVPDSTRIIAENWYDRPEFAAVPSLHQDTLFWVIRIVAFVVILIEWVCFSFVTVFVVMWIVS